MERGDKEYVAIEGDFEVKENRLKEETAIETLRCRRGRKLGLSHSDLADNLDHNRDALSLRR